MWVSPCLQNRPNERCKFPSSETSLLPHPPSRRLTLSLLSERCFSKLPCEASATACAEAQPQASRARKTAGRNVQDGGSKEASALILQPCAGGEPKTGVSRKSSSSSETASLGLFTAQFSPEPGRQGAGTRRDPACLWPKHWLSC